MWYGRDSYTLPSSPSEESAVDQAVPSTPLQVPARLPWVPLWFRDWGTLPYTPPSRQPRMRIFAGSWIYVDVKDSSTSRGKMAAVPAGLANGCLEDVPRGPQEGSQEQPWDVSGLGWPARLHHLPLLPAPRESLRRRAWISVPDLGCVTSSLCLWTSQLLSDP